MKRGVCRTGLAAAVACAALSSACASGELSDQSNPVKWTHDAGAPHAPGVPELDAGSLSAPDAGIKKFAPDGSTDAATITPPDASTSPPDGSTPSTPDASAADASPVVTATFSVDPTSTVGNVGPGFVGLSYEKSRLSRGLFRSNNAPLLALFNLLGPSVLRIGGASADSTLFQPGDGGADAGPNSADAGTGPLVISPAEVNSLASFATTAGWSVIYGLNLASSTPSLDATEAAYVANALGSSLEGFELGSAPDLYESVSAASGGWDYGAYKAIWNTFASAIHDATPAPMVGPSASGDIAGWALPFAIDEASAISLLTQHYYGGSSGAPATISELLNPDPLLAPMLEALVAVAPNNGRANPYRIDECNALGNGGVSGVSNTFASALWAIDYLFTLAEYGAAGANFHGGGDAEGGTPIADESGNVVGVRPLYYGLLLFSQAGQGAVRSVGGPPLPINVSAYAIGGAGGKTSIVLSNKDETTTLEATVNIGAPFTVASATRLEAPSLKATSGVTLGGVSIGESGTFSPEAPEILATSASTFSVSVPPGSAVLVVAQ